MSEPRFKPDARKLIMENAPKILFVSILYVAISTIISELQYRLPGTSEAYIHFLERLYAGEIPNLNIFFVSLRHAGLALAVVLWLLGSVISTGFMSYCLKTNRKLGSDYKDIFDGFMFFGKIVLITIVSALFVLLWSMLLFFPGIVASYRYRLAFYILLDNPEKGVMQCINESKRMMHKNKLNLFLLELSFIGWFALNFIVVVFLPVPFAIPIISIWISPYLGLCRAAFYDVLVKQIAA